MNFKVSVIIPTYNRGKFLIRAINSVLSQTYENIEILIIDDNGAGTQAQKDTELTVKKEFGGCEMIRYIVNERNIGGAATRNYGAKCSSGDYLCFLDDDDIYLPHKVEKQLEFMAQNGLELSFTDIKMYNEDERLVDIRKHSRYIKSTDNDSLLKYHLMYHLTPTDVYMFSREGFFKTEGFQTRKVSQEFMLMLESIEKGLKIGYLSDVTAVQYVHNQGRVSQNMKRLTGDMELLKVKEGYFERLEKADVRFIRFRYNAVLGMYFLRNRDIMSAFKYTAKSFFISPVYFFREMYSMFANMRG